MILVTFFWISVLFILYAYFGYPLIVGLLARFATKRFEFKQDFEPTVTLLIAAYNESAVIARKLENCLELDYPAQKLQILVANDGSNDGTREIVASFAEQGVELVSNETRQGKMVALKQGMAAARGEIIVMSDATNFYTPETIRALVAPFVDPEVGIASGAKHIPKGDGVLGESEGLYWRYEAWIKKNETRLGSCINVTGEIYAFRRLLFRDPPDSIINDDFYMMLHAFKQGYRVVYTPEARSWERVSQTARDEIERRARIVAGRYQSMALSSDLFPFNRPLVAWQIISHKFMRPLVPFGMLGTLFTNLLLVIWPWNGEFSLILLSPPFNWVFLGSQFLFYFLALFGDRWKDQRFGKWLYVPTFLVNSNWAALLGFWRFITGGQNPRWQRVQRRDGSTV